MSQKAIDVSSRLMEFVVCLFSFWAGTVMYITPTLLRDKPPALYKMTTEMIPNWELSAFSLSVCIIHFIGIYLCNYHKVSISQRTPSNPGKHYTLGVMMRSVALLGHVTYWVFLTVVYVLLFSQQGQVTLASGMCPIVLLCASTVSYYVSKELGKVKGRLQVVNYLRRTVSQEKLNYIYK